MGGPLVDGNVVSVGDGDLVSVKDGDAFGDPFYLVSGVGENEVSVGWSMGGG